MPKHSEIRAGSWATTSTWLKKLSPKKQKGFLPP